MNTATDKLLGCALFAGVILICLCFWVGLIVTVRFFVEAFA